MAKYRQIYTEFWSDTFVLELDSQEKLFYLYLLTNAKSTQCGIYELSPRFISLETGCDKVLVAELLKKFCDYKKILYSADTNEIMVLNWIKYNVPNNSNVLACIKKEAQKIKSKVLLKILYKKYEAAGLDVNNIFKGLFVNVIPVDINDLSPIKQDHSADQSNNIIVMDTADESFIKPLDTPLIGATKHMPSNRIRSKEEEVINKEQRIINKEEVEEVEVPKAEKTAATAVGIKSVIKIFEENIHAITPLVYEKILDFTKHVSDEVIIMAITEAVNYNAKNIKYISKVINSWISEGIKTAKEVVTYQKKWNSNKSSSSINSGSHSVKSGSFCDYEQRTYDFDLLEKQLLGITQ
ncbi:DnaD domain protein [Clostridium estertheticum]|uniref:DnaD domain-containing protein n=1 Tax=Clostridium estertheticum TaxID=238834 RepID=UPI001C0C5884|nr:DnaD domain protein [Clostridium estertheticum]MBU3218140.1 DnaD domain protein [Clostridium estertheticum]WAG53855.1 DnaD domain protein [Clostridium estertheticum]